MLKELIVGAAAVAAGLVPLSGVASADTGYPMADRDGGDEIGLLNLTNLDALHNVNVNGGLCDNNINVLGVQVPVEDVANGIGVPILSPGSSEATGATPENCASSDNTDGGTVQGD
jgi:hypothetical protein